MMQLILVPYTARILSSHKLACHVYKLWLGRCVFPAACDKAEKNPWPREWLFSTEHVPALSQILQPFCSALPQTLVTILLAQWTTLYGIVSLISTVSYSFPSFTFLSLTHMLSVCPQSLHSTMQQLKNKKEIRVLYCSYTRYIMQPTTLHLHPIIDIKQKYFLFCNN